MRLSLILILLFTSQLSLGQKVKTIDPKKVCDQPSAEYVFKIDAVEEFKDTLEFVINVRSISNGKDKQFIDLSFSEQITHESSIIQVTKEVAIHVAVARVIENGKKYYLYALHLYRKEGKCWDDQNPDPSWSKFSLGTITNGYGIGIEGTSNFTGFSGSISIR